MGNFYVNYTVCGPAQQAIAEVLSGRKAVLSPEIEGCVVLADQESEEKSSFSELGEEISQALECPVLAVMDYDDDVLAYKLFSKGELVDEYNSNPGYFTDEDSGPEGGDGEKLCAILGTGNSAAVEKVLRDEEYLFAVKRHEDLARALGLPSIAAGFGYEYAKRGDLPAGLQPEDLLSL